MSIRVFHVIASDGRTLNIAAPDITVLVAALASAGGGHTIDCCLTRVVGTVTDARDLCGAYILPEDMKALHHALTPTRAPVHAETCTVCSHAHDVDVNGLCERHGKKRPEADAYALGRVDQHEAAIANATTQGPTP